MNLLAQLLARNNHRFWCKRHHFLGWRFGEKENRKRKETPHLVAWLQLPEEDRQQKVNDALLQLLTIRKFQFRISSAEFSEIENPLEQHEKIQGRLQKLLEETPKSRRNSINSSASASRRNSTSSLTGVTPTLDTATTTTATTTTTTSPLQISTQSSQAADLNATVVAKLTGPPEDIAEPVAIDSIMLPGGMSTLAELVAQNLHETWYERTEFTIQLAVFFK